ncbi:LysR family transcriptional regulator [Humibacter ginsenosidimutans]|uniref:LysR family transcriptional regulator n=1 Tax=Humibacter ginsenosidimutans TaxID=2599293 RepID=A0A5B8MA15_9MICO|nr:LysR family transcriptional regulator [Humibacter ginsenosidimutans]QDZ16522.1 LysR family transcriptional regulator [Humibacter ginsenosidimutans]
MDPHRLRLLRELGDRGSIAAVARALYITPSAVSQQLTALQREFSVPLTERTGRTLRLTEAGEALAAASAGVESALADAAESVDAYLATSDRTVSVGGLPSILMLLLPRLSIDGPPLHLSDVDVAVRDFAGRTADHDLVIAHRLPNAQEWPARVSVTPLFAEPLDVALPVTHRLAGRTSVRPHDLRGERWLVAHADFPLAGVIDHLGALIGERPVVAHEVNDFPLLAELTRRGAGIGMLPRYSSRELVGDDLALVPIVGGTFARNVDVLARPESLARAAVRDVLAGMRGAATEIAHSG